MKKIFIVKKVRTKKVKLMMNVMKFYVNLVEMTMTMMMMVTMTMMMMMPSP